MYKQYCDIHRQVVIGFGDGNPICSKCDVDKCWVLESCQQQSIDSFQKNQQKQSEQKKLIFKFQRDLRILSTSFLLVENYLINRLNQFIEQQLNNNLNATLLTEMIEKVEIISNLLAQELQGIQNTNAAMAVICKPKGNRLMELEKLIKEQSKNQVVLKQVVQKPKENNNLKQNVIQQENQQNNQVYDYFNNMGFPEGLTMMEVQEKFQDIPSHNHFLSEQQFYNFINPLDVNKLLYQKIMENKLCVEMAPQEVQLLRIQLQQMNRIRNYYQITVGGDFHVGGYSQNYMLNGRGMVHSLLYYENGYYVQGLLIWGQIIVSKNNKIIYEEIDDYEFIQTIRQISGQSGIYITISVLWNKYHLSRFVN